MFPVQYRSYNDIFRGKDCIVQARESFDCSIVRRHFLAILDTGTGKTLAFTLPLLERIESDWQRMKMFGRPARCLVLEPTRELAKQISNDFLSIKTRLTNITTVYGGKSYVYQESALKKGSDILVGTPGRVKDFLQQGKLNLRQCETIVLDEVDRMLDMGFQVKRLFLFVFQALSCFFRMMSILSFKTLRTERKNLR